MYSRRVHPCIHRYTLSCTQPTLLSSFLNGHTFCLLSEEQRAQPSPYLCKARSWWFMGKGHSVQSNEKEANFNQEMQSNLGTEGNVPKSLAEMPPNGTFSLPEDTSLRLGNPFTLLSSCLPRPYCQFMEAAPLHLISPQ